LAVLVVLLGTWMLERGLNDSGRFNPVEAIAAVTCLLKVVLASITIRSTTTSALGLSMSLMIFSASSTLSASPRAMMAFCPL
jgi:hypothetical protein